MPGSFVTLTTERSEELCVSPGCRAERSEGSGARGHEMLRCAQHDNKKGGLDALRRIQTGAGYMLDILHVPGSGFLVTRHPRT